MKKEIKSNFNFNIVDLLIILLVIACIVSIAVRAVDINSITNGSDLKEYQIYFKIDNIKSTSVDYILEGDTVRINKGSIVLGTIEDVVQHIPAVGAYNVDGKEIFYPDPEDQTVYSDTRYTVSGHITAQGKMTDSGFLLGGELYVVPNDTLQIVTDHIETTIKIITITEK